MSIHMGWGPAVDAEVAYRQQQVRGQFLRSGRRAARSNPRTPTRRSPDNAFAVRLWTARAA